MKIQVPAARALCLLGAAFVTLTVGCLGSSPSPVAVSGSVTLDGQPVSGAVITFEPLPGTPGPKASTVVLNGRYQIEASAKLQPGSFRIRISMLPAEMLKAVAPQAAGRVIAPEFDGESRLIVELEAGEQNREDFQVKPLSSA